MYHLVFTGKALEKVGIIGCWYAPRNRSVVCLFGRARYMRSLDRHYILLCIPPVWELASALYSGSLGGFSYVICCTVARSGRDHLCMDSLALFSSCAHFGVHSTYLSLQYPLCIAYIDVPSLFYVVCSTKFSLDLALAYKSDLSGISIIPLGQVDC